ncbi:MAG: quinolinate synthase NadA [Spirochaetota bacterium]|jgi:quinolinate synthase|nr:quinolinate synthase NadA [Spirochaetota bacterium]
MQEIIERIERLRRERDAIILAHIYQTGEIQDIADYVGDSLGLACSAAKTQAKVVVLAGVRFMAESVKLLNPEKTVLLPAWGAGCPMADMIDTDMVAELKRGHPGAKVVCYVNSSAAVKAVSDICCTSSNALRILASIPAENEVIFIPDKNLGSYLAEKSGRRIILCDGYCPIHQAFRAREAEQLRAQYPGSLLLAHPECGPELRDLADFIGSTTEIVDYCARSPETSFIIATERGVLHPLARLRPDARLIPVSAHGGTCPNMKMTTLEAIARVLADNEGEVQVPEEYAAPARAALEKMMAVS